MTAVRRYECPDTKFEGLSQRFMDIRKRVYDVPTLGKKAILICVPTTSGTGSEVTPFAVITDEVTGMKYPLADVRRSTPFFFMRQNIFLTRFVLRQYALTPSMAVIDPQLVMRMPKRLTAYGGIECVCVPRAPGTSTRAQPHRFTLHPSCFLC